MHGLGRGGVGCLGTDAIGATVPVVGVTFCAVGGVLIAPIINNK